MEQVSFYFLFYIYISKLFIGIKKGETCILLFFLELYGVDAVEEKEQAERDLKYDGDY